MAFSSFLHNQCKPQFAIGPTGSNFLNSILAHMLLFGCLGQHSVITHNWFVHYLWDIYGGFGHNGKIIQNSTHPSLPYSAITLQIDCLGQILKLHTLQDKNMDVKVSDTVNVTAHNWFVHYLWDIYGRFKS